MEQNEGGDPLDSDSNLIDSSMEHNPTPQCQPQAEAEAAEAEAEAAVEAPEIELEPNQNEEKVATDVAEAVGAPAAPEEVEEEAEPLTDAPKSVPSGKRKRGRPPKSQAAKPPVKKKENEEEEVCFICFDGGNLVCCDRRGCPKVYHAVCVNRDEAFFETKGKWNCGWHICSICERSAQYMCYTCTYSLCKGCVKGTGFVCVRGKKGFCETCYGTVMLIESKGYANEGKVGINFDDKNSFDCLFKEYWFDVKRRLSLAVEELENAKVPLKGSGACARIKDSSSDELYDGNDEQEASSDSSSGRRKGGTSLRKKVRRRSRTTITEESSVVQPVDNLGTSFSEDTEWASKDLLEFVAHMKGGDKSVLSQFDVQALLLEYIKQNNLRDPRRKSQIICDPRLESLFGKARVGHFEMLKLLESHFLIKEASQVVTDDDHGAGVDPTSQMDAEAYADGAAKGFSDKRRKYRKKGEEREPQTNLDDYAAIDVHNIGLIYLRRNLMEDLLDEEDKFTDKIVGAFVRIRIPSAGQKQDMYRLVQVVGTSKAAERYKTGKKTTNFILEILNLNKREIVTIDKVSNQDFTEEECKRLRQSIKCGLISRLTVGDIHEKARVLQAVRVNDWLESEKQRLAHLRDRASETGRRKELRECVEKLQLLSIPEERARRLNEVPEIHSDPKMDPDNESGDEDESDDRKQGSFSRPRDSSLRRGGPAPSNWAGGRKGPSSSWDTSRNARIDGTRDKLEVLNAIADGTNEQSWNHERDVHQPNNWETGTGPSNASWNNNLPETVSRQSHGVETVTTSDETNETEKIWHYKDPEGKIQGPFSMLQLRKWNTTGYFPVDLRIWRASENEEDSILLTDALVGRFEKDLPQWEPPQSNHSHPTTFPTGPESRPNEQSGNWGQANSLTPVGNDPTPPIWTGAGNIVHQNADRWASQPSAVAAPKMEMTIPREASNVISMVNWESSGDPNAWSGPPQVHSNQRPTTPFNGNPCGPPPSYEGTGVQGVRNTGSWNPGQDHRSNWSSNNPRGQQPAGQGYGQQIANWGSSANQASRNQWGNGSYALPTPHMQPASQAWGPVQGTASIATSPPPSVPPTGTGWASVNTHVPPIPHPVGTGWRTPNMHAHPAPFRPMGTGWGATSAAGVNDCHSAAPTIEHNRAGPGTNSRGGTWDWGSNSAMPQFANQVTGANHAHVQWRQQTGAPNVIETHSTGFPRNVSPRNHAVVGLTTQSKHGTAVNKNNFFDSGCPSPTPSNEREGHPAVQLDEIDNVMRWGEANEGLATGLAANSSALAVSDSPSELQSGALKLGPSTPVETDPHDNMSPIRVTEAKPIPSVLVAKPIDKSDEVESLSVQREEESAPAFGMKQDPDSQIHSPTPSRRGWEQNQTSMMTEPGLPKVEHLETSKLGGPQDTMRGNSWSLPSPTPASEPSGWNVGAVSPSSNNQNKPFSQPWGGSSAGRPQASQSGGNIGDNDASSIGLGLAPQDAQTSTGSAKGSEIIGWGDPAVRNANPSQVWGTWEEQMNSTAGNEDEKKSGWVTGSTEGDSNSYPGWKKDSQNSGWASGQEDTNGQGVQQNQSVDRYRGGHARDSMYESRRGGFSRRGGDSRHESRFGGDSRYDSRYAGDSRYDSSHTVGRGQRNERMGRDRRGMSSRTPPSGEGRGGICKFHESGYCKKGAACNYVHS